jgi:hypothetical protein
MKEIDGVKFFTQEEVNTFAGTARQEGRDVATREVLVQLGTTTVEEAATALKAAKDLKASQMTEAERLRTELKDKDTQIKTLSASSAASALSLKKLSFDGAIKTAAEDLEIPAAVGTQIAKLIDVTVERFEEGKTDIKAMFTEFLAKEENAHFLGKVVTPEGSGRRPVASGKPDLFASLRTSMGSIRQ